MTQEEIDAIKKASAEDKEFAKVLIDRINKYKTGGLKEALKNVDEVVKEGKDAFVASKAVYDLTKKDGKTTSEFILVAIFVIAELAADLTGHPIPFDTEATLGGLIAIYTAARAFLKAKSAA